MAAEHLDSLQPGKPERTGSKPTQKSPTKKVGTHKQVNKSSYPRFTRSSQDLIKVGWSKREKNEYRHRAERGTVDLIVVAIESILGESPRFSTDELFPVIDPADGSAIPDYQGYLVLRWLRDIEAVVPRGRSAYTVSQPGGMKELVDRAWKALSDDEPENLISGDNS